MLVNLTKNRENRVTPYRKITNECARTLNASEKLDNNTYCCNNIIVAPHKVLYERSKRWHKHREM